jgi:lipopolysaccharide export system protein LptA
VPDTQILTISGNVKVDNAMGALTGPELVIDLATNSSVFTGGSGGRVTGVFTPQ